MKRFIIGIGSHNYRGQVPQSAIWKFMYNICTFNRLSSKCKDLANYFHISPIAETLIFYN